MIVSDLNYLEVITEETSIEGSSRRNSSAVAQAEAIAIAKGAITFTKTLTLTLAISSVFSQSG